MKAWHLIAGVFALALVVRRRMRAPLDAVHITSPYGPRKVNGVLQDHNGVDLRADIGTPVYAVGDAVVTTGYNQRSGNYLLLSMPGNITAGYAHLKSFHVGTNARVSAGDIIGTTGNTGNTRGAHLHFTIRVNGETVNPAQYVQL